MNGAVSRVLLLFDRPSYMTIIFKHLLLCNCLANQSQISFRASWGRGKESLYKLSRSHDQDGRHSHRWLKPLKVFVFGARSPMILKLGMYYQGHKRYKFYINDDPGMTLTYLMPRSNLDSYTFELENCLIVIYHVY